MEYTNDVIFKIHYKKDEIDVGNHSKCRKFKKLLVKFEKDEYFTIVMLVSVVVLFIDFFIFKSFIEIVNLL